MAEAAQKKKVSRTAVKKVKDKWKAKQWFTIRAPKMFNGVAIAETLSDESEKLVGRVAEVTLQDLSGDLSKMHVKLAFKVNGVRGTDCATKYVGHELTSDYIRRLTRRKHSKVDGVFDVTTADGWTLRVKPFAITEKRAKSSQEAKIRHIAESICAASAKSKPLAEFVKELVNGDLALNIFKEARKVYPLKRVEIRKSQVMREPEGLQVEEDVFAMPAKPEPAPPAPPAPAPAPEAAPVEEEMVEDVTQQLKGDRALTEEERVDG